MKFLMIPYVLIACLFGFFGILHADDIDKNDCFKINWRMIIFICMMMLSPIPAKFFGLL